jgi:hypothetical protein
VAILVPAIRQIPVQRAYGKRSGCRRWFIWNKSPEGLPGSSPEENKSGPETRGDGRGNTQKPPAEDCGKSSIRLPHNVTVLPHRNGNFIDDLKALCYYHEAVKSGSDAALDTGPGN